jgi:hypothetical protein
MKSQGRESEKRSRIREKCDYRRQAQRDGRLLSSKKEEDCDPSAQEAEAGGLQV